MPWPPHWHIGYYKSRFPWYDVHVERLARMMPCICWPRVCTANNGRIVRRFVVSKRYEVHSHGASSVRITRFVSKAFRLHLIGVVECLVGWMASYDFVEVFSHHTYYKKQKLKNCAPKTVIRYWKYNQQFLLVVKINIPKVELIITN